MRYELIIKGHNVKCEVSIPIIYKEVKLECGYRIDLLVEDLVVVELKSVEILAPIHTAQILTQMKFAQKKIGLLINFNVTSLKQGIKRYVL